MTAGPGKIAGARIGFQLAANAVGYSVLAFLMLPILAVVPASFNNSSFIRLPPAAMSLRWYRVFFADPDWLHALLNSLSVALLATALSVGLGLLAALGLERAAPRLRAVIIGLILSPLIVPVIMTSIALYYVSRYVGLHGTVLGLAMGHALLCMPFVVINVGVALKGVDPDCRRAAEGLGASPWRVLRTITLPLIFPGLVGGAAFSFLTSFDEVVIAIFLTTDHLKTLPVKLWEIVRVEITPVAAVGSTLFLGLTVLMFLAIQIARSADRGGGHVP